MMPFSVRSSVVRGLLILGVVMVMLLIASMALQLSGPQLEWIKEARGYAVSRLLASPTVHPDFRCLDRSPTLADNLGRPATALALGPDWLRLDRPGRTVACVRCSHEHEHQQLS